MTNTLIDLESRKIAVIDFLDTFCDSPLQDLAKLRQDTAYGWILSQDDSIHSQSSSSLQAVQTALCEFDNAIYSFAKKHKWDRLLGVFEVFALCRII